MTDAAAPTLAEVREYLLRCRAVADASHSHDPENLTPELGSALLTALDALATTTEGCRKGAHHMDLRQEFRAGMDALDSIVRELGAAMEEVWGA